MSDRFEYIDRFEDIIRRNLGCAVIFTGSDSDREHIGKLVSSLSEFEVPVEVRIVSAHKQLKKLENIMLGYDAIPGALAYIVVAGGTDAMSGTVSYNTYRPTISCPPDGLNENCLRNPPGSSNAFILRPENVGRFVAQMFSHVNPRYRELIEEKNRKKNANLEDADERLRRELSWYGEEGQ